MEFKLVSGVFVAIQDHHHLTRLLNQTAAQYVLEIKWKNVELVGE